MKYFCDLCGKQIVGSKVNPRAIASISIIEPRSQTPPVEQQACADCTPSLKVFIQAQQKKHSLVSINEDLNLKC